MNKEITFLDFVVKFCFENDHRKFADRYDEWRKGMLPTGGGKDLEDYAMGWFSKAYENAMKAQREICAKNIKGEYEYYNEFGVYHKFRSDTETLINIVLRSPMP